MSSFNLKDLSANYKIIVTRGLPGCGKSTTIHDLGLSEYVVSADNIRLMIQAPIIGDDGPTISQKNNAIVFSLMDKILEERMGNGSFTIVDVTCSSSWELEHYLEFAEKYGYELAVLDFSAIPLEEAMRRNAGRVDFKRVPEKVLKRMDENFKKNPIPDGVVVIPVPYSSETRV